MPIFKEHNGKGMPKKTFKDTINKTSSQTCRRA